MEEIKINETKTILQVMLVFAGIQTMLLVGILLAVL